MEPSLELNPVRIGILAAMPTFRDSEGRRGMRSPSMTGWKGQRRDDALYFLKTAAAALWIVSVGRVRR